MTLVQLWDSDGNRFREDMHIQNDNGPLTISYVANFNTSSLAAFYHESGKCTKIKLGKQKYTVKPGSNRDVFDYLTARMDPKSGLTEYKPGETFPADPAPIPYDAFDVA